MRQGSMNAGTTWRRSRDVCEVQPVEVEGMTETDNWYGRGWGVIFGLLMQLHPDWNMTKLTDETCMLLDYIDRGRDSS